MVGSTDSARYKLCEARIVARWPTFLSIRRDHLSQAARFGKAPEQVTEQILSALFTTVLDWRTSDINYQVSYADMLLTASAYRWVLVEAKRPGALAWHRQAVARALDQACRYADEQDVRTVAISDGKMFYAADRVHGGLRPRVFVDLESPLPPADLWWLSVFGIYNDRLDPEGAALQLLPIMIDDEGSPRAGAAGADELLDRKHNRPARCFAYVGNARDPRTWKLPYLLADGSVDRRRLTGAINAVLKSHRGERVLIPEAAIVDVLVRLGKAAKSVGRLDPTSSTTAGANPDCYELLRNALRQHGRLADI